MAERLQETKRNQSLPIMGEVAACGRRGSGSRSGSLLFPGSFNPFTKGHSDIVERALCLFDRIVVAVGYNEQKGDKGDVQQRVEAIRAFYSKPGQDGCSLLQKGRVEVMAYSGLTVDAAQQCGATAILRSVRSVKDYEYELQMADVNRQLTGIDTVVLFARPELASISSSVVRELQHFGQDVSNFLP